MWLLPFAAAVEDPPLVRIWPRWEYSRPRPPPWWDTYAATISNGLCDHTRAMLRPEANIVRACVCVTLRTELATFGRTAATLPAATARAWIRTGDRADYESGFGFPSMSMVVYLAVQVLVQTAADFAVRIWIATQVATDSYEHV